MTTVAIVEDNLTVRETMREWIDSAPGCRCVGTCATSKEGLAVIPRLGPDVVLMDIHLGSRRLRDCLHRPFEGAAPQAADHYSDGV